ncbi:MAG TPA: HD domain-containing protein [Bacteroidia bacterium]|nr:HD domain-containing protein [Bacteroidia bacterium]
MKFKPKIINDPVYGFVSINYPILLEIINHPYFQRLRRIKQLGLTNLVYPGALHTRFHHAIGAMHLMQQAIQTLKSKGVKISEEEEIASMIAILLHDIGHGPFSHALENTIVSNVSHEDISLILMHDLNKQFNHQLDLAIKIFEDKYQRKFFHQLVSSQLDTDRLDYLLRDSFFTGVSEGVIGTDRIIKMLTVVDDKLVVEQKGIYSIEKFLIARRLMYWQVYLHKTVLSAENMLVKILQRSKKLTRQYHYELFATPALQFFLKNNITKKDFANNKNVIQNFVQLDDNDIMASIKVWANSNDFILSTLCQKFIQRNLFRTILQNEEFSKSTIKNIQSRMKKIYPQLSKDEFEYFVISGNVNNNAYIKSKFKIEIYDGKTLRDIAKASDNENIEALRKTVTKYYLCYDKIVDE